MRKCHLRKKVDGVWVTVYSGTQKTHMDRMLDFLLRKGEEAYIQEDPRQPRRKRENQFKKDVTHG